MIIPKLSNKKIILVLFSIIIILVGLTILKHKGNYWCCECYSYADGHQWLLGCLPHTLSISKMKYNIQPSKIYEDFFSSSHSHKWIIIHGNEYVLGFYPISSIDGPLPQSLLAIEYNDSFYFRGWLKDYIKKGLLSRKQFLYHLKNNSICLSNQEIKQIKENSEIKKLQEAWKQEKLKRKNIF